MKEIFEENVEIKILKNIFKILKYLKFLILKYLNVANRKCFANSITLILYQYINACFLIIYSANTKNIYVY